MLRCNKNGIIYRRLRLGGFNLVAVSILQPGADNAGGNRNGVAVLDRRDSMKGGQDAFLYADDVGRAARE
jgi:hypothetical protein